MATDRQQYDYLYPQNGETYEKVRAIIYCPRCKENYWAYITKKGKKKGITIKLQQWSNLLFDDAHLFKDTHCREKHYNIRIYQCNVCGFTWQAKYMNIFCRIEKIRKEERVI